MVLIYLARPISSYPIPAVSLLPPNFYEVFKDAEFIDPAYLDLGDTKGKGMQPWEDFIYAYVDLVVLISSGNIVTSGCNAELEAAKYKKIEVLTPYLDQKKAKFLSVSDTVRYNDLGLHYSNNKDLSNNCPGFNVFSEKIVSNNPSIPIYRAKQK